VLALLLALAACKSDSATGPGGTDGLPAFTAKIDGTAWQATFAVTAQNPTPGLYSITATRTTGSNAYTMVFALYNIRGPGTYALGVAPNVFGGTAQLSQAPSSGWATPLNGVAGEIVITTLTATRMVATFQFTAEPILSGTTGTKVVTEGKLDIPVAGTGGVAPDNAGSRVTGSVGGAFSAAGATATITNVGGSNPIFTLVANNSVRGLSISLANMTGPGTYALSATTPIRTIGVTGTTGNLLATWASQGAGGSGSVTISSLTATRIAGTFNATLVPLGGGATGNLTVSGTFDMGRT
jgi:hypothetical protein